jgi:hypothetical protein
MAASLGIEEDKAILPVEEWPDEELSPKVGDGGNREGGISWGA